MNIPLQRLFVIGIGRRSAVYSHQVRLKGFVAPSYTSNVSISSNTSLLVLFRTYNILKTFIYIYMCVGAKCLPGYLVSSSVPRAVPLYLKRTYLNADRFEYEH